MKFQHFSGKPKNYPPKGLSPDEARVEFNKLAEELDAVVDYEGPTEDFKKQVAIKVSCTLIDRDAQIRSQGYTLSDKSQKNASQGEIDKAYLKLHTNMEEAAGASNQMSRKEVQVLMAQGSLQAGSSNSSAFDGQLARLGGFAGLRQLIEDEEEKIHSDFDEEQSEDEEMDAEEGKAGKKKKKKTGSGGESDALPPPKKVAAPKLWLDRGLHIGTATREQNSWRSEMKSALKSVHTEGLKLISDINANHLNDKLLPEITIANPRFQAIGLILGLRKPLNLCSDQPSVDEIAQSTVSPPPAGPLFTPSPAKLDAANLAKLPGAQAPASSAAPPKEEVKEKKPGEELLETPQNIEGGTEVEGGPKEEQKEAVPAGAASPRLMSGYVMESRFGYSQSQSQFKASWDHLADGCWMHGLTPN